MQFSVNSSPELAERAVENLKKYKINTAAYWEFRSSKDKIMYIVGSGLFGSFDEAKNHQKALKELYSADTIVHKFK